MISKEKVGDSFGSRFITPVDLGSVLYTEQCGMSECDLTLDMYSVLNTLSIPARQIRRGHSVHASS